MKRILTLVLATGILATGCAGPGDRMSERDAILETYMNHAGEIRHETVFPRVRYWTSLGDTYLALRTLNNKYFLLDLEPACSETFRPIAGLRLALEQQTSNRLTSRDVVRIGDRRCRIVSIRAVDHEAVRAELAQKGLRQSFIRADSS